MAFYGRVTNEAKTSMTFDKVYANRVEALANANIDGVFTGRFILVEYSAQPVFSTDVQAFLNNAYSAEKGTAYQQECANAADAFVAAQEEQPNLKPEDFDFYEYNYRIDKIIWTNLGRGYDSTVWRKIIDDKGTGNYVMLAELNSVVPTFTVEAEAPGDSANGPIQPHFDEDSTNVLYNLHVGAPWDFRIKGATANASESDGQASLTDNDNPNAAKAIYINKNGLNPNIAWDNQTERISSERINQNEITVKPTGKSGVEYVYHVTDPESGKETLGHGVRVDTQEMKIQLPSVGDTIATLWDGIYGDYNAWKSWYEQHAPNMIPSSEETESTAIKNLNRKTDTAHLNWEDDDINNPARYDGLRLISKNINGDLIYTPQQINNLTGALHTLYDAIGQNIDKKILSNLDLEALTTSEIAEILNKEYAEGEEPSSADRLEAAIQAKAPEADDNGIYFCENNNTFYFKNYEAYVKALDPVQDEAIIEQGSKLEKVTGTIKPTNVVLYKKAANAEKYTLVRPNEKLQPNMMYYQLNLNNFVPANEVSTTLQDLDTLVDEHKLVALTSTQAKDTIDFLSAKPGENELTDNIKIIEEGPIAQEICAYFPEDRNAPKPFVDYTNKQISTYPTFDVNNPQINAAKLNIFYQRIRDDVSQRVDDQGQIVPDEMVYTTVLKAVGITNVLDEYLATNKEFKDELEAAGYPIDGLKPIYKWPNTTKAVDGLWYIGTDGKYTMSTYAPGLTNITPDGQIAEILAGIETYKFKFKDVSRIYEPNKYWKTSVDQSEIWLNTQESNDSYNPTYYFTGDIAQDLSRIILDSAPGVNGLDDAGLGDDMTYQAYFIPGQLYTESGEKAEEFNSEQKYYKYRSVVVLSDPLGDFNEGELWNTELDLSEINNTPNRATNPLVLGVKLAKPHLYELKGYLRDINTVNGWILALNRMIGNEGDKETRDRNTIVGTVNYLNDKLDKFPNLKPNQLLTTDINGHITTGVISSATPGSGEKKWITVDGTNISHDLATVETTPTSSTNLNNTSTATIDIPDWGYDAAGHISEKKSHVYTLPYGYKTIAGNSGALTASNTQDSVAITGDNWITTTATTTNGTNSLVVSHTSAQTITVESSTTTLSFGDTFSVTTLGFDATGHKGGEGTHTIILPTVTVSDITPNNADVITAIDFTNGTTATFSTTRANVGSLLLTGYTTDEITAAAVTPLDTLNVAIGKLQQQISATENGDNVTAFTTTAAETQTAGIVSSLVLNNKTLSATTVNVGNLLLDGYTLSNEPTAEQIAVYEAQVTSTDSINQAFAKVQYQVNSLNTNVNDLSANNDDIQNQLNLDNNTNKNTSGIKFFAHRGLTPTGIVENTIHAFVEGYKKGYRCFETDVRVSQDGVPILNHNDNIDSVIIADTNYEALATQATALGYTLVTLNDYLKFVNILNIEHTVLEIKAENTVEGCAIIASLVKRYQLTDRIIFNVKGNTAYADAIREVLPRATLLTHYDSSAEEIFSAYKTTGKVIFSVVPSEDIENVITQAEMERLHANGYGIYLVPVNNAELTTCINMGFPYIEIGEAIKNTLNLSQAIYDSIGINVSPWEARIGEVITLGQQVCAGQMTSDGNNLWFSIISPKMIPEGATVTFSGNVNIKHPQGEIAHATEINSVGTLTVENISGNQIYIKIVLDPASTFTDDTPLTLQLGSGFQMSIIQQ